MVRRLMRWLRSLLFFLLFYPGTLYYVLLGMAASPFGARANRAIVHGWADFHHALARFLLGIDTRVEGILPSGPHLIAVKHQAMYETVEMLRIIDTPVVVMKRELYEMPLFGWMTRRYGAIPVDRNAGSKALRLMLARARQALDEKRPILIFPEGTRVAPGETPPLRPGFAGLYRALGLPVLPIALDSGRLWGSGMVKSPGTVRVLVGDPIPAGLARDEIEARVHAAINRLESAP